MSAALRDMPAFFRAAAFSRPDQASDLQGFGSFGIPIGIRFIGRPDR
jgi:hypothetical protein